MREAEALARLEAEGLVRVGERRPSTTPRWQAAMARASLRLLRTEAPWDLRLPIAQALNELFADAGDEELASYVEVLLPIEAAELVRLAGAGGATTGA